MRGNAVMKGYLKNEKATEEAFHGGWFWTGDLACKHPNGFVEIKDRAKDIIISGGENISSVEIENVLFKHPNIREAAVIAKPDEKWGEVPCAFIVLNCSTLDRRNLFAVTRADQSLSVFTWRRVSPELARRRIRWTRTTAVAGPRPAAMTHPTPQN